MQCHSCSPRAQKPPSLVGGKSAQPFPPSPPPPAWDRGEDIPLQETKGEPVGQGGGTSPQQPQPHPSEQTLHRTHPPPLQAAGAKEAQEPAWKPSDPPADADAHLHTTLNQAEVTEQPSTGLAEVRGLFR